MPCSFCYYANMACKPIFAFHAIYHFAFLYRTLDFTHNLKKNPENTYQYYIAQNTDTSYTDSLQKSLAEVEKAISNLIRAIEQGIFNDATKQRMDELDEQKVEIKAALASAKLKENLGLTKEHIVYFLHQFTNMDYTDSECKKRFSPLTNPVSGHLILQKERKYDII